MQAAAGRKWQRRWRCAVFLWVSVWAVVAQPARAQEKPGDSAKAPDYSGMYTFLRDGEFVQVTVEDAGRVSGFVSRYGDLDSDKGAFLDQFFKSGKLDGSKLTFTTEVVHGTAFDFAGTIARGTAKTMNEEGYYVLQGKLVETNTDRDGKSSSKEREVTFRSFPRRANPPAPTRE